MPSSTPYCVPGSNQVPGAHIQDMTCADPYPVAGSPFLLILYVIITVPPTSMKSTALTTSQALIKTPNSRDLSCCYLIQSPTTSEQTIEPPGRQKHAKSSRRVVKSLKARSLPAVLRRPPSACSRLAINPRGTHCPDLHFQH